MRAWVQDEYGPPSVLRLEDVPTPTPRPDQVLVRVAAVSLNLSDWETLIGSPLYSRIGGLRRPKRPTLGSDIAGHVEAIGSEVTNVRPGDAVYGDNLGLKGGFADYAVAPARALARVPEGLSLIDAATIPQAGPIALQGVTGHPTLGPDRRVLILGAGGGSGSFAVQLAKAEGAHVTAVDKAHKLDHLRGLGADVVVDHAAVDVFAAGERYDHVLDLVAHRSVFAVRRLLADGGRYLSVGGTMSAVLQSAFAGPIVGRATGCRIGMLVVRPGPERFAPLAERVLAGDVRVHVDQVLPLEQVPEALALVGAGRPLGKLVVTP
jgi:NADPH:quinone reductase-like Zn-dependent oxidoreductase